MRHFDLILVSDLRFPGGTSTAIADELRALRQTGLTVGVRHHPSPILKRQRPFNSAIKEQLGRDRITLLADVGERLRSELVIIHNPSTVDPPDPTYLATLSAERCLLVAHHAPYDADGRSNYDIEGIQVSLGGLNLGPVRWAPVSDTVRQQFEGTESVALLGANWDNIIFSADWRSAVRRPRSGTARMGRHSRDHHLKWPATRDSLLATYPTSPDFDVRFLGGGETLRSLVGGLLPSNWTTYGFNEIAPRQFLSEIDFYVYFHHPSLVEAFGRAALEASMAGCVLILPESSRSAFGEAALYAQPHEVPQLVLALQRDPQRFKSQVSVAFDLLSERHSPMRFLERLDAAMSIAPEQAPSVAHLPRIAVDRHADAESGESPAPAAPIAVDICFVADLRALNEGSWRAILAAEALRDEGLAVAVQHLPFDPLGSGRDAGSQLAALTGKDLRVVRPGDRVTAQTLILCSGERFPQGSLPLVDLAPRGRVAASRVLITVENRCSVDRLKNAASLARLFYGEEILFTAPTASDLDRLRQYQLRTTERPIPLAIAAVTDPRPSPRAGVGVVGLVLRERPSDSDLAVLDRSFGFLGNRFRILTQSAGKLPEGSPSRDWHLFGSDEIGWERFLGSLDALAFPQEQLQSTALSHPVAWCLANTVPVLAPGSWLPAFGDLAIRPDGPEFAEEVGNPARLKRSRLQAMDLAEQCRGQWHPSILLRWLESVAPPTVPQTKTTAPRKDRRTVLFATSNGVGMGHLTRALAIARRLPQPYVPVFMTASQGFEPLVRSGYLVEYMPFHGHTPGSANQWNAWIRRYVQHVLATYRPAAVVFDGSHPYAGLITALATDRDIPLVWVRRGMWRAHHGTSGQLERARLFDRVIEPRDIAESLNRGPQVEHPGLLSCDPIRLLDKTELLSRAEARRALGLRRSGLTCLVQLNAGSTTDTASTFDRIKRSLDRIPKLQVCLAHWLIGGDELAGFSGVRHVRAFPLSMFFAAFDFVISAAGYNSFNELISFGKPAIFFPDEHPIMDDQEARAAYAEQNGAAFNITRARYAHLDTIIEAMQSPDLRRNMAMNARTIALPNGADAAAQAILELI